MPGPKQRPSRKVAAAAAAAAGGTRPADDDDNGPATRRTGAVPRPTRKGAARRPSWDIGGALLNVAIVLGAVSLAWFCWASYVRWRLTARLTTPLPAEPAVPQGSSLPAASPDRFWGSYRPGVYFGMKTRSPRSPVAGLMWMEQTAGGRVGPLRHTCEQGDALARYGWLTHDGRHLGVHEALERDFSVRAAFVKRAGGAHGGDWSWRVTVKPRASVEAAPLVSLLVYVATDGQGVLRPRVEQGERLAAVDGSSEELGDFRVTFAAPTAPKTNDAKYARYNSLRAPLGGLERVTEVVRASLSGRFVFGPDDGEERRYVVAVDGRQLGASEPSDGHASTLVVHQLTARAPFQMEVLFESGSVERRDGALAGAALTRELAARQAAFDARFERAFGLAGAKGFPPAQVAFAKATLSNALGGVGYFYGRSVVRSPLADEGAALYWPAPLLTAVPSRSFFPRGFLWDEGFHQLLVWRWDAEVARDIVAHWLDLLNADGWIPREQILGAEAQSKVPAEFVVQHSQNANPPTFFLTLRSSVAGLGAGSVSDEDSAFLRRIFPRLRAWFDWYNVTQSGPVPYSFRWRGRDADTSLFLNPKTLTSGLDDYPRASHPSEQERHVDLRCWMALAAGVMADIARTIGEPHQVYARMHRELSDNDILDALHWAEELQAYADWGNHTEAVALVRERVPPVPGQQQSRAPPQMRLVRAVRRAPSERFVNALGYVSLFPLLLGTVEADSPRLPALLDLLRDESRMWTPFGLRSLSRSDPLYQKRNTEHDPPYWRGAVWVNVNYLAARALHRYAKLSGPQQRRAGDIYNSLRENVVGNVYRQYAATGYVWEQYSDSTGRGQGSHPFTGWTSLVVLMMAEEY
uniref:Mannosyl-oligosaccharide glucosidase n=1 Tax=Petromyzon marinus TaxID=7757 RepID=A0AAJ7UAI5_PETMA|nr:mannosyl-oligosaccharide glucosidase [Petromyzon marinus]XP_032832733.1 mannosyl-oligosaccharide glucosidase [Petromyzon marinus]XP_032832734.1 mannosyl-oligosaccharide glucosidase [Petromyzon marinus]